MPSPRTYTRRTALRLITAAFAATAIPALPAVAAEREFQMFFPQDPLLTTFTSSFGDARSGGRAHQGNDLMAPKMSPVYAAAGGTVTMIKDGPLSGRWIAIEHGDGWETWYMHLNNDTAGTDDGRADWSDTVVTGVREGIRVLAGQHIGWVGDSGNAEPSSPHTHFELHRNGGAIDPYSHLRDAQERALAELGRRALPELGGLIRDLGSPLPRPIAPLH